MTTTKLALTLAAALLLSACNDNAPSAQAPVAPKPATAPVAQAAPAAPENTIGKSVYGKACALCHAAGVAGAPRPGDKADWAPRLAQGKDTLYTHALEGFTGSKGAMPARGGNSSLPDDQVKAAVDFMADQSK
ncbi:Cytochrome c family protein [plant metagenome]|uniref:Cytochrome c family protein n=1 Tax=plant metagenome TaxID=1297885 RepID=A0A484XQD1_9ZZZZ